MDYSEMKQDNGHCARKSKWNNITFDDIQAQKKTINSNNESNLKFNVHPMTHTQLDTLLT